MIRPICRDTLLLSRKAEPAVAADLPVAVDLADTLRANAEHCVGMAANMIGVPKSIIAVCAGPMIITMLNPQIIAKAGKYRAEEGCLSLAGVRQTDRYTSITVRYQDTAMVWHTSTYKDWVAQIIQHEIDHLQGILI